MMQFFPRERGDILKRTFYPAPPPLPRREWSDEPINEQLECSLFTYLPAEIRNEIYHHVFKNDEEDFDEPLEDAVEDISPGGSTNDSLRPRQEKPLGKMLKIRAKEGHPLSLLLTCRKINQEATILAYHTHKFSTPKNTSTFHALQRHTSPLSSAQINAISSLAYDISEAYKYSFHHGSTFIANCLLLFPNLTNVELRINTSHRVDKSLLHNEQAFWGKEGDGLPRVPAWLNTATQHIATNRSLSWQQGEKWRVSWPQVESGAGDLVDSLFTNTERETAAASMSEFEDLIEPCGCGCRKPSWIAADLIQETGRKVRIQVAHVHYWSSQFDGIRGPYVPRVRLIPGAEPLPLSTLAPSLPNGGASGFGWQGEPEFWDQFRARHSGCLRRILSWMPESWESDKAQIPVVLEPEVEHAESTENTQDRGILQENNEKDLVRMSAGRTCSKNMGRNEEKGSPSWWRDYWELTD